MDSKTGFRHFQRSRDGALESLESIQVS